MKNYILKRTILIFLACFTCLTSCSSNNSDEDFIIPPHITEQGKQENALRIMTYNIATFTRDPNNLHNYQTIANMVLEKEADLVCLNELDSCTTRTGKIYQLEKFANILNWDFKYGAAMPYKGGTYGEGIATKEKAIKKFTVALPKGDGAEPRVLVVMEMEDYVIATTHLDHSNEAAHKAQVNLITETMNKHYKNSEKPVFLGGDLNAKPDSETMQLVKKDWEILSVTMPTFPSHKPTACIDYIIQYKNGVKVDLVNSQVLRWFNTGDASTASDHLPVIVDVILPKKIKK